MAVHIFDPVYATPADWPEGDEITQRYIATMGEVGVTALIGNVRAQWMAVRSGNRLFPVTINNGETGDSYVSLPHSAYILYGREELGLAGSPLLTRLLSPVMAFAGVALRGAGINRVVQLDNWLLSTCLHGDWQGTDLPTIRTALCQRYPRHVIGLRSLDSWSCPGLLAAVRGDGWTLLPSRQIWVTDDPAAQLAQRHNLKEDARILRRSGLTVETGASLDDRDARRIASLYEQLYLAKHSRLNPWFTAAFVQMSHHSGLIAYHLARDADGCIQAFAGTMARGDMLTCPILGYATDRPRREGLYRIAALLITQAAARQDVRLHGSAGAGTFKRGRGATGIIEYCALYTRHLGAVQHAAIATFARGLDRWLVPQLTARGL
ncbi:GNAT family N-acetyltransferase [Sphingobium algorifonticola]|nr:GNAT family N-acetyltransferase [Sphingobium algorifonticola]